MQLPWKAIMGFDRQQFQRTLAAVCSLALVFATTAKGSQSISLMPSDPEGLVGQDMHLWCSLADGGILRDANFTIVYRNTRTHRRLPANDSVALNATTVMLIISNLTNAYDLAMVFCWAEGESDFQVIKVGQAPPMPDIRYFRYLNWEKFVFAWKVEPKYNGFKTKYTAWFKSSSDNDFIPCDVLKCETDRTLTCIAQTEDNCTVPTPFLKKARLDGLIYFKVNGTNKAGNVTSETVEELLEKIVEPGQVNNLRFKERNGSDRVSYWLPDSRTLNVRFHVVSKENSTEEYKWLELKSGKQQLFETLPNLKPYTAYRLSTRVEYYPSQFRSNWTRVTFISHEEVPSQAPKVCGSCFERESNALIVHFQPLTKEQSRGNVSYTTRLLPLSIGNSVPEQEFSLRYSKGAAAFKLSNVSLNVSYRLNVSASTSAGSSQSTYIDIPTMSEGFSYPTNCTVMSAGDDTEQIVFRWNIDVDSSSSSQKLKSYTIFWCNGSMNRLICDDPLEWMEVDSSQSSASVRLTGGHSGYIFGIAATTVKNTSSGIQWSCYFYNIHSVGLSPYIHPGQIDETAIEIWLSKPPYNPKKGFIYGYNLYYAEQDDQEEYKKIYVDERTTRGVAVVEGLARGKSYLFKAESLTLAGPSDVNIPMKLATKPFSLSLGGIAGIVVTSVFVLFFAIIGLIYCLRCPLRIRKWIKQFEPLTPEVITEKSSYNEQYPKVPSDYCAVVEISSKDDDHPNRQYNEEGDTVSNYSAVKSNHGCVSLSGIKMPASLYGSNSMESHLTNILPPLEDGFAKPDQALQVGLVSSSLSDRFDNSSDAESDSLTISRSTSPDSKEHAFLVPDNSRIDTATYVGSAVSRVVAELSEMYRLLPSVTERRHPKPSLLATTQDTIDTNSANGRGLNVFESVLSVLPQTTLMASSVLPSVEADERTPNDSKNENILPKIGSNLIEITAGDVGVLDRCCEVSSTSEDGSGETGDQVLATGVRPVDPPSIRSSLSGYSSRYDGTEPSSYVASSERTNQPTSNQDDEGIYL